MFRGRMKFWLKKVTETTKNPNGEIQSTTTGEETDPKSKMACQVQILKPIGCWLRKKIPSGNQTLQLKIHETFGGL